MYGLKIPKDSYMKGYRIRLYPTESQKEFIEKCINVNRFVYNWALEKANDFYVDYLNDDNLYPVIDLIDLNKEFTEYRKQHDFLMEVPHNSCRSSIKRVIGAYKKFLYSNCKSPRFKTKKNLDGYSYDTRAERMYFDHKGLRIEGLPKGEMIDIGYDCGLSRAENPKFYKTVISRDKMGNYYIGFTIMQKKKTDFFEENNIPKMDRAIGIDINNKKRLVLSTGETINSISLEKEIAKLNYCRNKSNRDIARRKEWERANPNDEFHYSKKAEKRALKTRKAYNKLINKRKTYFHTVAKRIVERNPKAVVMENLSVEKFLSNHNIAKNIFHSAFTETVEIFEKKCEKFGIPFIKAPNDFKSSQICSNCGNIQDMPLCRRYYRCKCCGLVLDRDINAALNLEALAY